MSFITDVLQNTVNKVTNQLDRQLFSNDYLRDYTHASKTFRSNTYENAPKYKFLFHAFFEIDPDAWKSPVTNNYSVLVKTIKLPSFSIDSTILNQYNRKRLVQTKLKYDPVTVVLHDDNASQVTGMWQAYSQYYYGDMRRTPSDTGVNSSATKQGYGIPRNTYGDAGAWETDNGYGYQSTPITETQTKIPFFKSIKIYGMWQQQFVEYTLVNPIITKFDHDTYDYAEGNGVMTNTMTIDYENMLYNAGNMRNPDSGASTAAKNKMAAAGAFAPADYDIRVSPLYGPGTNSNLLGPGGVGDTLGGIFKNISNGQFGINDIRNLVKTHRSLKDGSLKRNAKAALGNMLTNTVVGVVADVANGPMATNIFPTGSVSGGTTGQNNQPGSPMYVYNSSTDEVVAGTQVTTPGAPGGGT